MKRFFKIMKLKYFKLSNVIKSALSMFNKLKKKKYLNEILLDRIRRDTSEL